MNPLFGAISIHNVVLTEAFVQADLASTPITIKFEARSDYKNGWGEVCLHLENAPLAVALAKVINETIAAFAVKTEVA